MELFILAAAILGGYFFLKKDDKPAAGGTGTGSGSSGSGGSGSSGSGAGSGTDAGHYATNYAAMQCADVAALLPEPAKSNVSRALMQAATLPTQIRAMRQSGNVDPALLSQGVAAYQGLEHFIDLMDQSPLPPDATARVIACLLDAQAALVAVLPQGNGAGGAGTEPASPTNPNQTLTSPTSPSSPTSPMNANPLLNLQSLSLSNITKPSGSILQQAPLPAPVDWPMFEALPEPYRTRALDYVSVFNYAALSVPGTPLCKGSCWDVASPESGHTQTDLRYYADVIANADSAELDGYGGAAKRTAAVNTLRLVATYLDTSFI